MNITNSQNISQYLTNCKKNIKLKDFKDKKILVIIKKIYMYNFSTLYTKTAVKILFLLKKVK